MRVVTAGAMAGAVKTAFRARGHAVAEYEDASRLLDMHLGSADLVIVFPPCKYLCSSGLHWNTRQAWRAAETEKALALVARLLALRVPHLCLENPIGAISRIRKPDQIIQPYNFGVDASKRTGLWLVNLPQLQPTKFVPPRMVNGKPRWGNQSDDGQNNAGWKGDRVATRRGHVHAFAEAMAEQWGVL